MFLDIWTKLDNIDYKDRFQYSVETYQYFKNYYNE